jgi:hypothetical protein
VRTALFQLSTLILGANTVAQSGTLSVLCISVIVLVCIPSSPVSLSLFAYPDLYL